VNANAPLDRQAGKEPGSRQAAPQARQWARLILISGLWLFGLWILRGLLVPLVWSVILAFASWPLYRRFERFLARHRHGAAAAPALFALLVGLIRP